jgi:hypothetical protein
MKARSSSAARISKESYQNANYKKKDNKKRYYRQKKSSRKSKPRSFDDNMQMESLGERINQEQRFQEGMTNLYKNQIEEYQKMQKKAKNKIESTNHLNFKRVGKGIRNEINDLFTKFKDKNESIRSSHSKDIPKRGKNQGLDFFKFSLGD